MKAREHYYYLRDEKNRPIVTVCLLESALCSNLVISRGMAICSESDTPCKKDGMDIAFNRATWAYQEERSFLPIRDFFTIEKILDFNPDYSYEFFWDYKAEYNPELTNYESWLIHKCKK